MAGLTLTGSSSNSYNFATILGIVSAIKNNPGSSNDCRNHMRTLLPRGWGVTFLGIALVGIEGLGRSLRAKIGSTLALLALAIVDVEAVRRKSRAA